MPMKLPPLEREQTNDLTGRAVMDAMYGNPIEYRMPVPFNWPKTTNNHKREGRAAGMMQDPCEGEALDLFLEWLRDERETGHMGPELLSDSHYPHHARPMASAHRWAWDRRTKGRKWAELYDETRAWWARDVWLCDLYLVPSGPLAGQIVGWGARFAGGRKDERNIIQALINGRDDGKGEGYYRRAATRPDTFPCLVVRELVRDGAFQGIEPVQPRVAYTLTVTQHADGHACDVVGQSPKDPSRVVVRYSDGLVWWQGGKAPSEGEEPAIGGEVGRVEMEKAT